MISIRVPAPRQRPLFRMPRKAAGAAAALVTSVAALAGGLPAMAAAAGPVAAGSDNWTRPRELAGPPDFSAGGQVTALLCASGSDCTAVGTYQDRPAKYLFFAITERHGVWNKGVGITVPADVRKVRFVDNPVLACASAGNCAASISYDTSNFARGAVVVSEKHGTWGKAMKVGGSTSISAISCAAPGTCTATLASGFLLNEVHGTWRRPFRVPGLADLHGSFISLGPIACPAPGDCSAAGNYNSTQSFVVNERNGVWANAKAVSSSAGTVLYTLSCPASGNCVAAGYSYPATGFSGGFTLTETHGRWGAAEPLPGTFRVGGAGPGELACTAVGTCSALGAFSVHRELRPFVSAERNGTWHAPQIIAAAGPIGSDYESLACSTASACVLTGAIPHGIGQVQAATATETHGSWGPDKILPGILALDHGQPSAINALSCPPRSRCTAIGSIGTAIGTSAIQLFITTQG